MGNTNTGGGANVGRDASAGGNLSGRDMTSSSVEGSASGMAVGAGNRVDIHTEHAPYKTGTTDSEILHDLKIALLGDQFNRRNNPGLVATVDELLDKVASLIAANSAQSYRQNKADEERALIAANNRSMGELQERMRVDNQTQITEISQRQTTYEKAQIVIMRMTWITLTIVGLEGLAIISHFIR